MRRYFCFLAVIIVCLLWALRAEAQNSTAVSVNDAYPIEGSEALGLTVYFTVESEQALVQPDASASILLEDGTRYPAQVDTAPFYIAIVLDASGSMRPVIDDIRQAAIELVQEAPSEVQFVVIRFAESIDLKRSFTNNQEEIIQGINEVEVDDSGTCLYDVATTAVRSLDQIAGNTPRRVICQRGQCPVDVAGGDALEES